MAAGDGMADIMGRKYGKVKWPWSKVKSYAGKMRVSIEVLPSLPLTHSLFFLLLPPPPPGTASFAAAAFLVNIGLVSWFHFWGLLGLSPGVVVAKLAIISVICSLVELVSRWRTK